MEVTLEDTVENTVIFRKISFNPYSNGSYSGSTTPKILLISVPSCFNPYSNGSYSGSRDIHRLKVSVLIVSILILMEVTLEDCERPMDKAQSLDVSILILMEVTLEELATLIIIPSKAVSILILMEVTLEDL